MVFANILGDWVELDPANCTIDGVGVDKWLSDEEKPYRSREYVRVYVEGENYEVHQSLIVVKQVR